MGDEMGEAYSTHGTMRHAYRALVGNRKGRNHEDPCLGGRIILKLILGNRVGGYGLYLHQDRDWWKTLVNTIMNLRVL
jgi:hypothetical protein